MAAHAPDAAESAPPLARVDAPSEMPTRAIQRIIVGASKTLAMSFMLTRKIRSARPTISPVESGVVTRLAGNWSKVELDKDGPPGS